MSKKVVIGIELSSSFVSLLRANLTLGGYVKNGDPQPKKMDPTHVLAVVVLGEAMGAYPEDIWARIPFEFRPDIDVVPSARKVKDGSEPFEADKKEVCRSL